MAKQQIAYHSRDIALVKYGSVSTDISNLPSLEQRFRHELLNGLTGFYRVHLGFGNTENAFV